MTDWTECGLSRGPVMSSVEPMAVTPSRHHIHTIVRTPNGGDYGTDLLAQHHARFGHSPGGRITA